MKSGIRTKADVHGCANRAYRHPESRLKSSACALSAARRKASASAPPPAGSCGLRGACDVIAARGMSRGLPCAARSLFAPVSSVETQRQRDALAGDSTSSTFNLDDVPDFTTSRGS